LKTHRIFVEDNDIGFDEKYLELIFTLFQRLHGKSAYEGTGMGLAICQKIVERHHGTITARSTPGQGATFIITLPEKQPTED
jgi:signal transduction histidine kinase